MRDLQQALMRTPQQQKERCSLSHVLNTREYQALIMGYITGMRRIADGC